MPKRNLSQIKYHVRKANGSRNQMTKQPLMRLGQKPHHSVTIRTYFTMTLNESSSQEFHSSYYIAPYAVLSGSQWAPLQQIYEKMRVRAYNIHMYLPRQSMLDKGRVVAFLERDSDANSTSFLWTYGKLLEMPGRQERNNLISKIGFNWSPIDAEDYDYKPINTAFDSGKYGLALFAGWVDADIITKPVIEIQMTLDFIDLLTAPSISRPIAPGYLTGQKGLNPQGRVRDSLILNPSGVNAALEHRTCSGVESDGFDIDDDDITLVDEPISPIGRSTSVSANCGPPSYGELQDQLIFLQRQLSALMSGALSSK